MSSHRDTFSVEVAGLRREFPLFAVSPSIRIAVVNILGDTELTQAAARDLATPILSRQPSVLVTAEAKSIPLAYALSLATNLPFVVLRKAYKPYMGNALQAETLSITTGQPQTLYLDEKDRQLIDGKNVAIIDDVISTGSTLMGIRLIVEKAGGTVVAQAAIFTEGDRAKFSDVIALGHLPVFAE
jgi:adenine phosphoribosyltransferase